MGKEEDVNWKLASEFISQQSWAERVVPVSRDGSKVVLKKEDRAVFKYLFAVNGRGLPKMAFYVGM